MNLEISNEYLHKVIFFPNRSGCIPEGSICFCVRKTGNYYWVSFKEPILGHYELKIHEEVIRKHGVEVRS